MGRVEKNLQQYGLSEFVDRPEISPVNTVSVPLDTLRCCNRAQSVIAIFLTGCGDSVLERAEYLDVPSHQVLTEPIEQDPAAVCPPA